MAEDGTTAVLPAQPAVTDQLQLQQQQHDHIEAPASSSSTAAAPTRRIFFFSRLVRRSRQQDAQPPAQKETVASDSATGSSTTADSVPSTTGNQAPPQQEQQVTDDAPGEEQVTAPATGEQVAVEPEETALVTSVSLADQVSQNAGGATRPFSVLSNDMPTAFADADGIGVNRDGTSRFGRSQTELVDHASSTTTNASGGDRSGKKAGSKGSLLQRVKAMWANRPGSRNQLNRSSTSNNEQQQQQQQQHSGDQPHVQAAA
jgi:hypothetical protein